MVVKSRNHPGIGLIVGVLSVFIGLSGCNDSGTGPNNDPAFSDLSSLGTKPYVAYTTPDGFEKPDTVKLSFNYNPSKMSSILVQATLDNGATWNTVSTLTPGSATRATVQWIPKDADSATRNFFGFKTGTLKLSDPGSAEAIESESFTLIGAVPLKLIKPTGGETFGINDSVIVEYSANMDLLSNIQAFFKTDRMSNWNEFVDDELLNSPHPPIMNLKKWFIPSQLDASIIAEAENFAQPIKILLQDYSNDLAVAKTDYITITP
jgi:hypothetical protein